MPRDYRLYLDDILESVDRITEYVANMDFSMFVSDQKTIDAVVRNLEIIGEAAKNLPDHITSTIPEIDWRKITGLRNILAHEYFGINKEIIWDIVQNKISVLKSACEEMIKEV